MPPWPLSARRPSRSVPPDIPADARRTVIELHDVSHTYTGAQPVQALRGVSLKVETGQYLAITGSSGSGKSTMLNIMGLLERASSGVVAISGKNVTEMTERELSVTRGSDIGFVFQAFHLMPHRTALENVMLSGIYQGRSATSRREAAHAALDRVGLASRSHALPTQLSGGEKQRVALARALAHNPSVLLCDEPTGSLDSRRTDDMLDLFDALNADGVTIVVITHESHVAERAEHRVTVVDGTLRWE